MLTLPACELEGVAAVVVLLSPELQDAQAARQTNVRPENLFMVETPTLHFHPRID
jgi:hypothetical protein